jgi:hypothetical protein
MKPDDTANLIASISAGISVLSLGLASWAFQSSRKATREQITLQAKLTAIEAGRRGEEVEARQQAQVMASISILPTRHCRLVVTNGGPAIARSVTVEISSAVQGKQPPAVFGRDQLPVDLQRGQSVHFDMAVAMEDAERIKALIRWVDDAGSREAAYTLGTR